MGNIKEINIKSSTCYFFDDMVNIKKIDKRSYKNIDSYYIGYSTKTDS